MIFVKNAEVYATVWKVTPSDNKKYIDIQMSTSEKRDDEYENSGWFCRVIGHALNSLKNLQERDRIKISSFKQTNLYNKDKGQFYFRMIILDAEILDSNSQSKSSTNPPKKTAAKTKPSPKPKEADDGEDLPW